MPVIKAVKYLIITPINMKKTNTNLNPPSENPSPSIKIKNSQQSSTKSIHTHAYVHENILKSQSRAKNIPSQYRHKYSESHNLNTLSRERSRQNYEGQRYDSRYGSKSRKSESKRNSLLASEHQRYPTQKQFYKQKYADQYNSECKSSLSNSKQPIKNYMSSCQHCGQSLVQSYVKQNNGDPTQKGSHNEIIMSRNMNIYICDEEQEQGKSSNAKQYQSMKANIFNTESRGNQNSQGNQHSVYATTANSKKVPNAIQQNKSQPKKHKSHKKYKISAQPQLSQQQKQQLNIFLDNYQNILNQRLTNLRAKWNQLQVLQKSINNVGAHANNPVLDNSHSNVEVYNHNQHTLQIQNEFYVSKITELQNQLKNKEQVLKELNGKLVDQQSGYDRKNFIYGQDRKELQWENKRCKEENALLDRENRVLKAKLKEFGVL